MNKLTTSDIKLPKKLVMEEIEKMFSKVPDDSYISLKEVIELGKNPDPDTDIETFMSKIVVSPKINYELFLERAIFVCLIVYLCNK